MILANQSRNAVSQKRTSYFKKLELIFKESVACSIKVTKKQKAILMDGLLT